MPAASVLATNKVAAISGTASAAATLVPAEDVSFGTVDGFAVRKIDDGCYLLATYDLEGGRILVGGEDIAAVTQESLRANIGMVTQDTSLLHRSVRDNILYGRPDASRAELERAAGFDPTGQEDAVRAIEATL